MYILVNYTGYYCGNKTFAWENFEELKQDVIHKLDIQSWKDKSNVDLRSVRSCVYFMTDDYFNVRYTMSKSYKKFSEYRCGKRARSL